MLNENTLKLLNTVGGECQGSGYKVFAFSELIAFFPENDYVDTQTIRENIELLAKHGYISVKHLDQEQVCLSVLDKGRKTLEIGSDTENQSATNINGNFWSAFWGAFVGGAVTALIFAFLFLILGGK
ncbi:MAG: hypothetical protein IJX16_03570 [Clostridia bacterium]|nr:hypothetical protein [Clostridia bacterium]